MDHMTAASTLSAALVIRAGGWHPRYARVVLIDQDRDRALVLVDGNGDGAELELEYWSRDPIGGWQGGSSGGHGPLDQLPSAEAWDAGEFVCAIGRSDPSSVISIRYDGVSYSRRPNEFGLWGFLHDADSDRPGDLPTVTAVTSQPR